MFVKLPCHNCLLLKALFCFTKHEEPQEELDLRFKHITPTMCCIWHNKIDTLDHCFQLIVSIHLTFLQILRNRLAFTLYYTNPCKVSIRQKNEPLRLEVATSIEANLL